MKIIYIGETPSFESGLPPGMMSIGFNAENKPVFEITDGSALPDGAREAVGDDLVGLPDPAKAFTKQIMRKNINDAAGDTDSILGTAADGATAGTIMEAILVLAMRDAAESSLKTQFKVRINALFGGDETGFDRLATRCDQYISDIQTGAIKVPFLEKYGSILPVFDDVSLRNTQVASAVAAMAEQPQTRQAQSAASCLAFVRPLSFTD